MLPQDVGGARFLARDDKTKKNSRNGPAVSSRPIRRAAARRAPMAAMETGPRAVNTPLRHGNPYKRAAREADTGAQGALDL